MKEKISLEKTNSAERVGRRYDRNRDSNLRIKAKNFIDKKVKNFKENSKSKIKEIYKNSDKIVKGLEIASTLIDVFSASASSIDIDRTTNQSKYDIQYSLVSPKLKESYLNDSTFDNLIKKNNISFSIFSNIIKEIGGSQDNQIQYVFDKLKDNYTHQDNNSVQCSINDKFNDNFSMEGPLCNEFEADYTQKRTYSDVTINNKTIEDISKTTDIDNELNCMQYPDIYDNLKDDIDNIINTIDPDICTVEKCTIFHQNGDKNDDF